MQHPLRERHELYILAAFKQLNIELVKELEKRTGEIENGQIQTSGENGKAIQKKLNDYLQTTLNIELYEYLTDGPFFKDLFEPLEFFDLLSCEKDFLIKNADDFAAIKTHYDSLALEGNQKYFFLYAFRKMIIDHYNQSGNKRTIVIEKSIELISKMFESVDKEIFPFRKLLSPSVPKKANTFAFGNYQGLPENIEYVKVINEDLVPYYPTPEYLDRKFTWPDVLARLEERPDYKEKVKYLIDISTEYGHLDVDGQHTNDTFVKHCELEIGKLKATEQLQSEVSIKSTFRVSEKQGARTNLIRIFNALHSLKFITNLKGEYPNKVEFMKTFGGFLNIDLSNYDTDLSQAFERGNLEPNLKVFQDMIEFTKKEVEKRLETPKSKH